MFRRVTTLVPALAGVVALAACADVPAPTATSADPRAETAETPIPVYPDATPAGIAQLVENVNAELAARGSELRLSDVWLMTVGNGVHPYRRLRIGARWPSGPLTYYLDKNDFTPEIPAATVETGLVRSYDRWNAVSNSWLKAGRVGASVNLGNIDLLDGRINNAQGQCVNIIDLTATNLNLSTGFFFPVADIVVAGWEDGSWFRDCLGSSAIIAATFTLTGGDANGDNYPDIQYVEQVYNEGFQWVSTGSALFEEPIDLESIATHENGHALGLDHFGGALTFNRGTLASLNFKHFYDPIAVMNAAYVGGEKRDLYPTDVAGLRALY